MTFRTVPPASRPRRRVPALALAMSLACSAFAQEPAPEKIPQETPPARPDESVMLPEDVGKTPNADAPILPDWMENEAAQPTPVTEPPSAEAAWESPDLSRGVAMNQALSTGETLLVSLGGLGGVLSSPFLAGAPDSPVSDGGMPSLRPIRMGPFDVNMHASLGVTGTRVGGMLYSDHSSVGGLFQGGLSAFYGRDKLATLWFSYDLAGNYPENPAQGRQSGSEGGSGGFDQNVSLIGSFTFPELKKVKFVFGAKYSSLSGLDRDTGKNSRRQIATALFATDYAYSDKTTFSFDVSMPVRQFSDAVSSSGITTTLSADTQITRKTSIGLGYTFGTLEVEDGADQIFHQALLKLKYSPSRFLLFDATAGVDFRDHGDSSAVTPIFGLSTTWNSQHGTLVTLAAERRVFNAASAINTNFTSTSFILSAYQRFSDGVMGTLSAGYEYTEYESFGISAGSNRTDKLSYVSAEVMVPLALHWHCSLNASAGKNDSETQGFDFLQVTFKTTLTF